MLEPDQPGFALEQMLMAHTDEGAYDQFEDREQGAEHYIRLCPESQLIELRSQIAEAFAKLTPEDRLQYFKLSGEFRTAGEFDDWLRTLDRRMEQALAGDHSEPLVYSAPE